MKTHPNAFCWTKVGDESGESLSNIIDRKDRERRLGNGLFMWGIGNALGTKVKSLVEQEESPKVLFSRMKSKPKKTDQNPDKVVIWTEYLDMDGKRHKLPDHIFLTSKSSIEKPKKKHYALVCKKETNLELEDWNPLNINSVKNLKSENNKIGHSQVTAVLESFNHSIKETNDYPVMFSADLVYPHYVTLVNPVELPESVGSQLKNLNKRKNMTDSEWITWLKLIKQSAGMIPKIEN